ncbi:MAG: electron transport complex subunit RsxC [candidate division WOR-3 bacterium]|nr:electron transport complex subunit RsxC [candidate division WOR-3 bacterium]MCX7756755.1 electron transport complex subunit RsxC [candidate division WOR-3 bacterium]MDW7987369.1 electron transport complex subunit RsxC [candidate division WOR-3 bacterium]
MLNFFFKRNDFLGGVKVREYKELSEHKPLTKAPIPKRVLRPYIQHNLVRIKPTIEVGATVKVGTKIGDPEGRISVPMHASISGKVTKLEDIEHPVLPARAPTCIIESDGVDLWEDYIKERDYSNLSKEELLETIRDAGIVGLGGAAFPTHIKLSPPKDKVIDTVIINGCECEPFITCDHQLMLEKSEEIIEGARIIAKILSVNKVIFAIEDNKPDAIDKMKKALGNSNCYIVAKLKTKYPQGAEKQLIKTLLNRTVPQGGLPFDVGVVVQNVGTTFAIYEACRYRKPLIERVVTVTGNGVKEPKNLWVRIGTPVYEIIEFCGGYTDEPGKLILGGPMTGVAQYTDDIPVLKGTSGIVVFKKSELKKLGSELSPEYDCIRCARCIMACPMQLQPTLLNSYIKKRDFLSAKQNNVLDCIECGCCAYVCPARIKLVHAFVHAKREIKRLNL